MSITDVKTAADALDLEPETRTKVNGIIDAALARGGMTPEERDQLLKIADFAAAVADVEIETAQDAIKALDEWYEESNAALDEGAASLEETTK